MNCKMSAQNALKVAIFGLKIENFSGEGAMRLDSLAFGARPPPPRLQILDTPLLSLELCPKRWTLAKFHNCTSTVASIGNLGG